MKSLLIRKGPWSAATGTRSRGAKARSELLGILLAVLVALGVGALLVMAVGKSVPDAYLALLRGAFGSTQALANTLIETVPLAFVGIGVALSFRVGVFNVGAEGQLLLGGMAAGVVGAMLPTAPMLLVMPAMMLSAAVAGALWATVASSLKVYLGSNEVLTTIMLNYVALYLVTYLLNGPARAEGSPLAQTERLSEAAGLPLIFPGTTLHAGILLAIVAALLAHVWLFHRVGGFHTRLVGLNPEAARNAGLPMRTLLFGVFAVSGALAGLAGYAQVAGVQGKMIVNLSPGYGYTGIVVALLGRSSPLGALAAAFFFSVLSVGGQSMETGVGVPGSVVTVIQYLIVLLIIARDAARTLAPPRAEQAA